MKKRIIFILIILSINFSLTNGQNLSWSKQFSGSGSVYAPIKLITDNSANIYLIGNFTGELNIGGVGYNANGSSVDAFIVKLNKLGVVQWVNTISGDATDLATGICLSIAQDQVIVVGPFTNTTTFSSHSGGSQFLTTSDATLDSYLVKYNANGDIIDSPIKIAYGLNTQRPSVIRVDKDDNYIITGFFVDNVQFLNTSITTGGTGVYNYLAKLSPDGNVIWKKLISGSGSFTNTRVVGVEETENAYYWIGNFQGSIYLDIEGSDKTLTSAGSNDIFIYKTDFNGVGKFYKQIGGSLDDAATSISCDGSSNLYFSGYFNSTTTNIDSTLNGSTIIQSMHHPSTIGGYDIIMGKYRTDGLFQWVKNGGTTGDDKLLRATFGQGFFVAGGSHYGPFTFDGKDVLHSTGSNNDFLGFVHDNYDNVLYTIDLGGTGSDNGQTATIDGDGSYIFVADFSSGLITVGSDNYTNGGGSDLLIVKYLKGSIDKASTNILCNGSANGTISISPIGPLTPPYTYIWKKGADIITPADPLYLTGLSADTYTLDFTDSEGFAISESFTITEPVPLLLTLVSQTNINCFGEATGSVTISATGGASPYTYNKNGGSYSSSTTFSSLRAGDYTFAVKDDNGCITTLDITITEPSAPLTLTLTGTESSATAVPAGGTSPYSYSWNSTPIQTESTATGLPAGTYTVIVTDTKNCIISGTIGVSLIIATTSKVDIKCSGDGNTGSATVTATGGTGIYSYSWDTSPIQTTQTATNLPAGTYTVTVTDNDSPVPNTTNTSVTIIEPDLLVASLTKTDITCSGYQDGSISVILTGGTAPYGYAWTKNSSVYPLTTRDIFNLDSGDYELTVTDDNDCTDIKAISISATPQSNITVSLLATKANCYLNQGNISGSITSSVSGASGSPTYLWNNGKTTAEIIANPGNYTLTVEDELHCNANATATISYGPQIAGNISVINKPCAGTSTGSLEFTPVLSGNGSLTYIWSNEQTTQSITDITAGTYSVTVADSKNCQYEPSTTLTEYALPTASFGGTTSICEGESTILSISLTGTAPWNVIYTDGTTPEVINGINTSPYSFSVSPTDTTTYSITAVSDAHCNGTIFGATATVNVNPIPIVTLTTPDKICIDATPINLTGGSPYGGFYTGDGVTGIAFDPATAGLGAHTITYDYSDAYGCSSSATSSITVNESPIVSITTSGKTAYCMGETISTILNALPSDAASYQWQLNGSDILNETNQTYQAVSDGLYSVTAHTAEGCSSTGDIEIVVNAVPDVSISTPDRTEYCQGETINALLTALPGDASSYQWKLDGSEILNETSQTYQAIAGGIYTVTASNADGCASTSEIEIIVNATPDVSITTSDKTEYCQGETISALLTALPSDATTYQWRLSGSDILDATNQTYNATATGLYSVVASNALSCSSTGDIEIVENTVPVIDISLGVDTVKIFTNDQHIFDAGVGFSSYLWNDDSSDQTLTVEAGTLGPGDYTYWVEVSNASGCAVRDTAILNINWPTGIYTDVDWSTTIFPNPTKGEFKINLFDLKADRVDVTILSSVGIVVFKKEFTTNTSELHETVNLENSSRGVYLIKITDKKTVITRKIVLE